MTGNAATRVRGGPVPSAHPSDDLTRVAAGTAAANPLGILQTSSTQIDILAARRADAITHLKSALAAYQRATTPQAQRAVSVTPSPSRTSRQTR